MSISSEIIDLESYLSNAYSKVNDKGGTIPLNKNAQNLASAIDSIPTSSIIIIPPEAGTLTSISVTSNPTKTIYNEGEYFDFTGLVITALYSSGQQFDVTNSCTYTMNQPLQYGDSSILVTYESQTTTISITVNAVPVPAPSTCIGLYHFNSSALNEATGNSGTTTSSNYQAGKFGNAIKVDSTFISEAFSLPTDNSFTIEFWIKAHANWGYSNYYDSTFFFVYGSDYNSNLFTTSSNGSSGLYPNESNTGIASSHTIDSGYSGFDVKNWNHIALVVTNGTYSMFVNGVKSSHGNMKQRTYNKFRTGYEPSFAYSNSFLIDELMFCTSAKYTSNFTPPNAPYYIE